MSRYLGPKLRIVRRLGQLPGLTSKSSKKKGKPGKNPSQRSSNKKKMYGIRLEEKQKLKFNYGITETQLISYVKEAKRIQGITGLILLQLLEMRLDSICYQSGWVKSIAQARQLITHGHVEVNDKKLTIPSFQCEIKDKIKINSFIIDSYRKDKGHTPEENSKEKIREILSHLSVDSDKSEIKILNYCNREDIPIKLNELLIIEYYSKN